ncbi:hypothetical protein GCM10023331_09880 [Algivirga pacifica]|uniref:Outer membrane protein beta-barrel domain-containing protein n=1 Tax=Algivirga pacifica TaxID=1162670 RepID=A0ABP9D516_9BACT
MAISTLQAQETYKNAKLIISETDTLTGLVNSQDRINSYEKIIFKDKLTDDKIIFQPGSFLECVLEDGRTLVSRQLVKEDNSKIFVIVEVLEEGKLSLFKYGEQFYVQKQDGPLLELSNEWRDVVINHKPVRQYSNKHIGILTYLFSDAPQLKSQLKELKCNEKSLKKVIYSYNKSKKSVYDTKSSKKISSVTIAGGLYTIGGFSMLSVSNDDADSFELKGKANDLNMYIGGYMKIGAPALSERIYMILALEYDRLGFDYTKEMKKSSYIEHYDVSVHLSRWKVPFGLQYELSHNAWKPYFRISGVYLYQESSESTFNLTRTVTYGDVVQTSEIEPVKLKVNAWSYGGEIGLKKVLNSRLTLFTGLRYEGGYNMILPSKKLIKETYYYSSSISSFKAVVGIELK